VYAWDVKESVEDGQQVEQWGLSGLRQVSKTCEGLSRAKAVTRQREAKKTERVLPWADFLPW
jgi:hypothetical protein